MFAVMPDHVFLSCPGFLASPILTPVVPLCCSSSLGSNLPASSINSSVRSTGIPRAAWLQPSLA
eukprot:6198810-Heterocapsa_arctica.AAC.1